jgi:PAS domain S-box-containing protein
MPDDGFRAPTPPVSSPGRGGAGLLARFAGPHRTSRQLITFGAIIFGGSLLAVAILLWQTRDATVRRAERDLQRFAMILGEQTLAAVQGVDFALRSLADNPRATDEDRQALHNEMRSLAATIPQLQNLFIVDVEGRPAASARSHPPPQVSVIDRSYYNDHRAGAEGPLFTSAFRSRIDGRWSIVVSRRLETPDGQFDGSIGADLNPAYLARFYEAIKMGPQSGIVLIDRHGTLLSRHPWLESAMGRVIPGSDAIVARFAQAPVGTFWATSPFDGTRRLHGYAALAAYPLAVVTYFDEEAVLGDWRRDALIGAGSLLVANLVIATLIGGLVVQMRRREMSEARFRDFAGAASDWYWETDNDLRFTFVSRVDRGGTDVAVHDAIGKSFRDFVLTLPGDGSWRRLEEHLLSRQAFREFLCLVRTPLGRVRHLNISGQPRFDSAGACLGYRGVARDITGEVEARSASAEANMRFLHAIENSNDGIAFWDAHDRFVLCNERYREKAGRSARVLTPGITFERFFWEAIRLGDIPTEPGKAAERLFERMERHRAATGEPYEVDYDGEWLLIRDQRTPNGGTLTVFTDITPLKSKDEQLRAAEDAALRAQQRFILAIEHSDDGFALWDRADRLVVCNERYRERAGMARDFLVPGVSFEEFFRQAIHLGVFKMKGVGDRDALLERRVASHRQATGEPIEMIRDGRHTVTRDQRMPDGGCLTISTEIVPTARETTQS